MTLYVPLALATIVIAALGLWMTIAARRRIDPGDFEKRLEQMRTQSMAGTGAVVGNAAAPPAFDVLSVGRRAEDEEEEAGEEDRGDEAPEGADDQPTGPLGRQVGPTPVRLFTDPLIGEFSFNVEQTTWERDGDTDAGQPEYLYIVAGPEGPAEAQRRAMATFVADCDGILERAWDAVMAYVQIRGWERPLLETESMWVEELTPGQACARSCVYFRIDGREGLPASVATADDWVTLEANVEP
jgi:hypothetical protein